MGFYRDVNALYEFLPNLVGLDVRGRNVITRIMRKALGETQTLRAGCSKVEPKKFAPPQTRPPSRGPGLPKFNQLEMVTIPSPTDPVWWRSMHAISSYRCNRPTNTHPQHTHTHTHTHTNPQTGPITIHCAAKLSAQCINSNKFITRMNLFAFRRHG